jgi:flagellar biosynthesis/type III secretory pathway chaperone
MDNNRLHEIIRSEMQLAEELSGLLQRQQQAIIHFKDGSLMKLVEDEQHLLHAIETLEQERVELMNDASNAADASLEPLKQKMKILAQQILDTNEQNRVLIDNAVTFVRKIVLVLTQNFTKQLVDTKV